MGFLKTIPVSIKYEGIDCVIAIYDVARMLERNEFLDIAKDLRFIADMLSVRLNERRLSYQVTKVVNRDV